MVANLDPVDVEAGLLRAIGDGDFATRAVYADWLEAHEESDRAEFLRTLDRIIAASRTTISLDELFAQLHALLGDSEIAWRAIVARDVVEQFGRLAWLVVEQPRKRTRVLGDWQLPLELRYLEDLAPEPTFEADTTIALSATPTRVVASLLAALRARLE